MDRRQRRGAALCLALALALPLTGCGGNRGEVKRYTGPTGEVAYPLKTEESIKYWVRIPGSLFGKVKNYGETEFAQNYMERTGIAVEYLHPAGGQEQEQQALSLLIASNDLPDIIEANWLERDPAAMIDREVILDLNPYFENYSPNLCRYLDANPDVNRQIRTDNDQYYAYPFIRDGEKLQATSGFMMRGDWLEELGLEIPETMPEWEAVLKAMQAKCPHPMGVSVGVLCFLLGGYGIDDTYYVDGGQVKNGLADPAYLQFLTDMHRWYQEGLIDPEVMVMDSALIESKFLSGESGVAFNAGGRGMGVYLSAMRRDDPNVTLTPVPYPAVQKGAMPEFGNKEFKYSPINAAAITTQAANPELCARFLDYSYSEEGTLLNNFGVEGESYEMVDGYPTYTPRITDDPEGRPMSEMLSLYVRAADEGPFVQDERYIEQYYAFPQQKDAIVVWSRNNHQNHLMPQITRTEAEADEFSMIDSAVSAYRMEMLVKFVVGDEPLENFDSFVAQLKELGLDRAIEIQQAALDRFNSR